jgi:general secretion pathway protein G
MIFFTISKEEDLVMEKKERGFTLIELMVVISILAILAALIAPSLLGTKEDALRTQAKVQIGNFEQALKLFYIDNGFFPTTEQGLMALIEKPTIGRPTKRWRERGYLEKEGIPKDPWGNPYIYISPGIHSRDFDIISYGSDGEQGGEGNDADVENWNVENE